MVETTSINASLLREQKSRQTNGWTPLVYPAFALQSSEDETNPCFPLDQNVLRAAVRELLILDKSINVDTLEVSLENTVRFRNGSSGPLYLSHVDPTRYQVVTPPKEPKKSTGVGRKKRSMRSSSLFMPVGRKKARNNTGIARNVSSGSESGWVTVEEDANDSSYQHAKVPSAEALVDIIVERAYSVPNDAPLVTMEESRNLRKVSDADMEDHSTSMHLAHSASDSILKGSDGTHGSNDISRFFDIQNRTFLSKETSPFLEVSIASEFLLRDLAHRITVKLVESFDDHTLRMFLGYKSSTLKRDRLATVLAEYFFDVSHAMFAWKQTERELLSEEGGTSKDLQKRILDTLFDSRALRKIGGFDDSSLLPHALSICRLQETGVSWKNTARSKRGRTFFKHHCDAKTLLAAGQKRRGQRVRIRHNVVSSSDCSETGIRSRSSSITSYDDSKRADVVTDVIVESAPHEELWTEERQASLQMPDVLNVSLKKTASGSWGVLLSKESSMCVVVRAPEQNGGLKIGDVILSVGDETQSSSGNVDWFRHVVNLFKSSTALDLVVRRVGSGQHTVVSDDGSRGESVSTLN